MLGTAMLERQAKAVAARDNSLDHRSGFYLDSDPLAFGADPSNRIGIHPRQQSRQDLENGDLRARARIGMTKFERDDAATYENHPCGKSRSIKTSSDVIIRSAPGIGSVRGFEPVAMTM